MNFNRFQELVSQFVDQQGLQIEKFQDCSNGNKGVLYIAFLKNDQRISFLKGFCKEWSFYKEGADQFGEGVDIESAFSDFQSN
jgi:hypothetical protein